MKVAVVFLGIGLSLLIFGIGSSYNQWQFVRSAVITDGVVIVEYSATSARVGGQKYIPQIFFTAENGEEFEFYSRTSTNFSLYSAGDKIRILYNPQNPFEAEIDKFFPLWGGSIILLFLGGVFTFIGGLVYFLPSQKRYESSADSTHDLMLQTNYSSTEKNLSVCIDGDSPYVLLSTWRAPHDQHKVYTFKSEDLWYDPRPFIDQLQLMYIPVKVDSNDYSRYAMDISMLPQVKNSPTLSL